MSENLTESDVQSHLVDLGGLAVLDLLESDDSVFGHSIRQWRDDALLSDTDFVSPFGSAT